MNILDLIYVHLLFEDGGDVALCGVRASNEPKDNEAFGTYWGDFNCPNCIEEDKRQWQKVIKDGTSVWE